jgi:DNA-binding IclR family transcriptional regulator
MSTVRRAVLVLGVLADSDGDLGTNEIARRAGVNPSTASRLLATLLGDEMVWRHQETGRWRLGLRMITMGNAALGGVSLREITRPHLVSLTETTGETASLSLPGAKEMITVDFVQSPWSVRSVAEIGRPSVPHATAVGKVFLACGGPLSTGPLRSYTPGTITDRKRLAGQVDEARERGWACAMAEREKGLNAVAVPILGADGSLAGVLGLQGPAERFDRAAIADAVRHLSDHAAQLSVAC